MKPTLLAAAVAVLLAACAGGQGGDAGEVSAGQPSASIAATTASPSPLVSTARVTPTQAPSLSSDSASPRPSALAPHLRGDTRNAWAFAPVSDPEAIVVEGSASSAKAYSTSKVLIVAGFLKTVVGGDPSRLTSTQRDLINRSLTASDGDAVLVLQRAIVGGPSVACTQVLRSIGDASTQVPNTRLGAMQWSVREQVRFMAALANGTVVSPEASEFILGSMSPIPAHRWGLGTIDARAFKGGWLRADTETRQMGIYRGYAVAILTAGQGPAIRQSDGDLAHVQQLNSLAARLADRLLGAP